MRLAKSVNNCFGTFNEMTLSEINTAYNEINRMFDLRSRGSCLTVHRPCVHISQNLLQL